MILFILRICQSLTALTSFLCANGLTMSRMERNENSDGDIAIMYGLKRWMSLFFLGVLLGTSAMSAPVPKDARIAVIGAGASGLTAAHQLRQLGYEDLVVYEKRDRVGGKIYSYTYQDTVFELGAFWAGEGYTVTDELAEAYDVEFRTEEVEFLVRNADGIEYELTDYVVKTNGWWTLFRNLLAYQKVQKKFSYLTEAGGFFQIDNEDLYLSFADFSKKYGIEALAAGYRPFWIGCGYGYYEETPAMYVLKLMMGSVKVNLLDALVSLLPWSKNQQSGLRRAPEGYQRIWDRLAATLPDVRLNSAVTAVERYMVNDRWQIDVSTDTDTETFDALIVATDLGAAANFLDLKEGERELFAQVENYNYHIYLFSADVPYTPGTMVFLDQYGTADTIGHATAVVNREKYPNVWTSGQLVPWGASGDEVETRLIQDIEDLGGRFDQVIEKVEWTYFPHVKTAGLKAGFYPKLETLQGEQNTYFVGGVLNFETVENTAAYAKKLVNDRFK